MKPAGLLGIVVVLLDVVSITIGLMLAHLTWTWYKPHLDTVLQVRWWHLIGPNPFMPSAAVMGLAWMLVMRQQGLYDPGRMNSSARIAGGMSRAAVSILVMGMFMEFLLPDRTYSRSLILAFCGNTGLVLALARLSFFRLQTKFPRPIVMQNLAIVGVGRDAVMMAQRLEEVPHLRIVGFLRPTADAEVFVPPERILGAIPDIQKLVNEHNLSIVVLATRLIARDAALTLATRADAMGLHVYQMPFTWGIASPRIDLARLGDLQLIDLTTLSYPTLGEQVKRAIDLFGVLVGGTMLLPFLVPVAAAIKLQDGGPIFFGQPRAGQGGRVFQFLKFRSMVVDAEKLRDSLAEKNEADGVLFKMKADPRITPFGHFIRKYSIDELPQLLNVLKGDMNIVGPRPLPMRDLVGIENDAEMSYWFELRSKVRPGITGLWQVSGRSDTGMAEMVRHDIRYVQDWTLWLDIVILFKTVPAVLKGRGAR